MYRLGLLEINNYYSFTQEMLESVKEIRSRKAAGLDGCAVPCLKSKATVIDWLLRLLNVCSVSSILSVDWVTACVVPLYKGNRVSLTIVALEV